MTTEELIRCMKYSDRILELIDNRDDFTRSDLQAMVDAIVHSIMLEYKK